MEITITKEDGSEEIVRMKPLLGRQADKIIDGMLEIEKHTDDPSHIVKYKRKLVNMASELTGKDVEWLNSLATNERRKFTDAIMVQARDDLDFLMPSQKSESSSQKDTAT